MRFRVRRTRCSGRAPRGAPSTATEPWPRRVAERASTTAAPARSLRVRVRVRVRVGVGLGLGLGSGLGLGLGSGSGLGAGAWPPPQTPHVEEGPPKRSVPRAVGNGRRGVAEGAFRGYWGGALPARGDLCAQPEAEAEEPGCCCCPRCPRGGAVGGGRSGCSCLRGRRTPGSWLPGSVRARVRVRV